MKTLQRIEAVLVLKNRAGRPSSRAMPMARFQFLETRGSPTPRNARDYPFISGTREPADPLGLSAPRRPLANSYPHVRWRTGENRFNHAGCPQTPHSRPADAAEPRTGLQFFRSALVLRAVRYPSYPSGSCQVPWLVAEPLYFPWRPSYVAQHCRPASGSAANESYPDFGSSPMVAFRMAVRVEDATHHHAGPAGNRV